MVTRIPPIRPGTDNHHPEGPAAPEAEAIAALGSHVVGDWGELSPTLRAGNERAIEDPGPVVSVHESRAAGTRFYVVTAADRSQTTVFLSGERA